MLGLVAPDSLQRATACVQVVIALAGAAKAKAMRAAAVINRRMAAPKIGAIDQQAARAGGAHLGERYFLACALRHGP